MYMVNLLKHLQKQAAGFLLVSVLMPAHCFGESSFSESKQDTILGKKIAGSFSAGSVGSDTQKMQAKTDITVFGKDMQAMNTTITPPSNINGRSYTEFYAFNKRIFTNSSYFQFTGEDGSFTAGLPPTEVRVPFFTYPVGPLLLTVGAGARFEANINAQNSSNLMIPVNESTLGINLSAVAFAAGFIEAYAKLFVIRGGIGGQVDVVDAKGVINARISFNGNPPLFIASAIVKFLYGHVYAFFDFFNLFSIGWSRLWTHDFYRWDGYCFAAGNFSCLIN